MSSLDFLRAARAAGALALILGLSACFRPLYGETASGQPLAATLQAIDVQEVVVPTNAERFGHYLRSELVYDLNGSGMEVPKRYKLALSFSQTLTTPIVDTQTGRAQSATINGVVAYTLTNFDGDKKILEGRATSNASYDRNIQRFASIRAARDAEIRLAKLLAEQIRTRLAAGLIDKS
jgi:LPS-assembly lipoprotein